MSSRYSGWTTSSCTGRDGFGCVACTTCIRSSRSSGSGPTTCSTSRYGRRPPTASSSSASTSWPRSGARRASTTSSSSGVAAISPWNVHTPACGESTPESIEPSTSSRAYIGLPAHAEVSSWRERPSSTPCSAVSTSATICSSGSGGTSTVTTSASWRSRLIAGGRSADARSVPSSRTLPLSSTCWSTVALASSSRCRSSTSSSGSPAPLLPSAPSARSTVPTTSLPVSGPSIDANGASGTGDEAGLATTRCTVTRLAPIAAATSLASRVLPNPAAPPRIT